MKIILLIAGLLGLATEAVAVDLPTDAEIRAKIAEQQKMRQESVGQGMRASQPIEKRYINIPDVARQQDNSAPVMDMLTEIQNASKNSTKRVGSDLMVFVSFSMPEKTFREYTEQAKALGAVLVLRGLKNGSWKETMDAMYSLDRIGARAQINPELFKLFKVTTVPAIVLADNSKSTVLEQGCAQDAAYESVVGDVSIEYALKVIRSKGRPEFSQMADKRLKGVKP